MNKSLASSEVGMEEQGDALGKPWGRKLREVRESRNLTVEDIAAELRLEIHLVQAIENEDLDVLPSAPFVKGYMRSYARLLDISDGELIAAYSELNIEDAPGIKKLGQVKETTSNHAGVRYATWALIAVGAVSLVAWLGSNMVSTATQDAEVSEAVESETIVVEPTNNGLKTQVIVESLPLSVDEQVNAQPEAEPVIEAEVAPVVESVSEDTQPTVSEPEPVVETSSITLRFSEDSWVEITDATGERLFLNIGEADSERTVEGVPPFSVLLGNAKAVSMEYNGAPYDRYRIDRKGVARFTLGKAGNE